MHEEWIFGERSKVGEEEKKEEEVAAVACVQLSTLSKSFFMVQVHNPKPLTYLTEAPKVIVRNFRETSMGNLDWPCFASAKKG